MRIAVPFLLLAVSVANSQITQFPHLENFDGVTPPALPPGWSSTQNRNPGTNDFTSASGSARSIPNAVLSTNARIAQALLSPMLDFGGRLVDSVIFNERRSNTDTTGVLVEASTDGGTTFEVPVSDTMHLQNPGTYVRRAFPLPALLSGNPNVRIQWRVLGDQRGGSTATLRFDDVRITTRIQQDIGLTAIRFDPQFPVVGDSVLILATVRNFGLQPAQDFPVEFYEDSNLDGIPQANELFDSVRVTENVTSGDSVVVSSGMPNAPFGDKQIIAQTVMLNDENTANDRRMALLSVGVGRLSVVVNEIMYGPTSPEPEWVELAITTTDSINLSQWKLSDRSSGTRYTITSQDFWLRPAHYVVVTRDTAAFSGVHPEGVAALLGVPALPSSYFNNDSDAVVVFDHRGAPVDSVHYRSGWGGSSGRSLERIDVRGPSDSAANWGSSVHSQRSTPGGRNSITPKDYDLVARSVSFSPAVPFVGDDVEVQAIVRNSGRLPANNLMVEFFADANNDSVAETSELFASQPISALLPGDSAGISAVWTSLRYGDHAFIVRGAFAPDEDTANNALRASISAGYPAGSVVVNEIMYAPVGEPEWLELYDISADSVNLKNLRIANRNTATRYAVTTRDLVLRRGEYVVLTKDTALFLAAHPGVASAVVQIFTLPTFFLNNTGDAAVVFDSRGVRMDSISYLATWGGANGSSLERVDVAFPTNDSANWGSSQDSVGSTPGRQNSLTPAEFDLRAVRMVVQGSSASVLAHVTVMNVGRNPAQAFGVALFHDADGDSVPQVAELIGQQQAAIILQPADTLRVDLVWNDPGYGFRNLIAQIDYSGDLRTGNNRAYAAARLGYPHGTLIVNEIMYAPAVSQPEFVELYNKSGFAVDLHDWTVADMRDAAGEANEFLLARDSLVVLPGAYVVLTSDSSIMGRIDTTGGILVIVTNRSLSLNNEGDDVVLGDLTRSVIDSVRYFPDWHNAQIPDVTGRSLERINPDFSTTDRRNWNTSADPLGGTPGRRNSIFTASVPGSSALSCSPNPFSPDGDGFEDFTLVSYEIPVAAALLRIRIFDAVGRIIRTLVNGEQTSARGSVVWDGMDDARNKVRMGIYIVLLEALDASGGGTYSTRGLVVVAIEL